MDVARCQRHNLDRINVSELRTLYPEIEPFDTGRLQVSSVHELSPFMNFITSSAAMQQACPSSFPTVDHARVWSRTIDASSTLRLTA
jgi:hypothetical protein